MDIGPGTLVLCIGSIPDRFPTERLPVVGHVYTVRAVDGPDHIWLVEIENRPAQYADSFGELSFLVSRFRPIDDSSIEIFRTIARDVPHRETVDV